MGKVDQSKEKFCVGDFQLSVESALRTQLLEKFDSLKPEPLTKETIDKRLPGSEKYPGVYQLFEDGDRVYIGKADRDLRERLRQHLWKLSGLQRVGTMTFMCLRVSQDLAPLTHEKTLIGAYSGDNNLWNGKGFGPKDPGKERDETKPSRFYKEHPINARIECSYMKPDTYSALDFLKQLKKGLPFLFRYQSFTGKNGQQTAERYGKVPITVPMPNMAAEDLIRLAAMTLSAHGGHWIAQKFVSHVVLYEGNKSYKNGETIYPVSSD